MGTLRIHPSQALPIIICYISSYYVWLVAFAENEKWLLFGANTFQVLAPLLAALFLVHPIIKSTGLQLVYWVLLLMSCLSYFLGQAFWNFYELVIGVYTPFPGWADVFYLLKGVFLLLALLLQLKLHFSKVDTIYNLLGIVSIITIILFFSLEYIIRPMLVGANSWVEIFFFFVYPLFDIAVLFMVLAINFYTTITKQVKIFLLGIFVFTVSHVLYTLLLISGFYKTGSFIDPLFSLGLLLVGASGFYDQRIQKPPPKKSPLVQRLFYPVVLGVFLIIWLIVHNVTRSTIDFVDIGIFIVLVLLSIRIILSRIENEKLLNNKLEELALARELQEKTLPLPIDDLFISISSYYKPSEELSGDLYTWYKIDEQQYGVLILDVMGHGVSSSLVSMSIKSLTQGVITRVKDPYLVMKELSRHMLQMFSTNENSYYFTAVYLLIDIETKTITYVNAGHPTLLWKEEDETVVQLPSTCPPIGIIENSLIVSDVIRFKKKGRLMLYTDGFLERIQGTPKQQIAYLGEILQKSHKQDIEEYKESLLSTYDSRVNEDDSCLVIVDIKK
ncbi:PP2C family protein-serine/threonine phosphatase [Bacillus alkalicellulosilyticus]|uniref:PP2C family protein-serine/threonine phosphatase n=1 Tax=Alkalihalobacterium alkalicellulosilyticum TaxID=1912214 RepID=UPI000996D10A|nr:PP2C family protein-serine/threonine phosphatase [Bacillus alkalicellulosilyticus]